jgi:hypothetical protein
MVLQASTFSSALRALTPTTDAVAAQRNHAAAFRAYMEGLVTVPPVAPTAHVLAESAMTAALSGQHLPPPVGITAINAGYYTYVTTVLAALATQAWIVAVPPLPPGPIDLARLGDDFTIDDYADLVHNWVTSIQGSVPPTLPAFWQ